MNTLRNGKKVSVHFSPKHVDTSEPGALSKMLRDLADEVDQWDEVDTGIIRVERSGGKAKIVVAHPTKPLPKSNLVKFIGKDLAQRLYQGR